MASNRDAARSRQRRRPLWKHIVFWGSAVLTGVLLAVFRAPEWAGYVAVAVGCFTLLPWFMVSGGRDGR